MKYNLGDIVEVEKKTINPQKTPNDHYCVYSLPGFDNGKTPERLTGSKILSNKIIIDRENYILFNKLNLKFKRVWRFKNDGENNVCSTEFLPLYTINNDKVDLDYLYYSLINDGFYARLVGQNSGTSNSHQRIHKEDLLSMEIDLPDLELQQKIVRILSALDQKIELNNKIRDNLLRVAHQIYINDVKSLPTVKTEKLGSLCKIKYGKGLPTSKILKSGYRVYGGNGIIGFYNEKMYDGSQVLISCRGAASGKVIFTRPECFVTNNSLILECDEKYHYFIKEFSLDREYYDYTTGSAQPQITIDNIKDVELPLPNDEVLTKFNTALCPIEKKFFAILDENEALAKLRDTLLPKLMSGEINLGDIQL